MDDRELSIHVVGVAYPNTDGSNRLFAVRTCRPGDPIELRPEPKHPLDAHAIAVVNRRGEQMGYVPADRAPWIGAKMRAGPVTAIFQAETRGGAAIRVRIGEGAPTLPPVREREIDRDDWDAVDPEGPAWGA
ncbi:HIRAN domain-containing protein [Sphingomonas solaris]|uniref:HIRAN domain-containing protein n=1 Tax=Alterirhizorhabdus solaris TaxID=2529389 RepID=A0A558R5C8_9SPHN|nr:HIRAN domain-containing protein [Sphingomonas solaris]TVV74583.1 hypothetical protein FOY91_09430 [Sphingomonas solaris]